MGEKRGKKKGRFILVISTSLEGEETDGASNRGGERPADLEKRPFLSP